MKGKIQVAVSVLEAKMIEHLAHVSGHSQSLLAGRAISEWLQRNYRDQLDLYFNKND